MEAIVEIKNISKVYPIRRGFRDLRGEGGILDLIRGRKTEKKKVLNNINLEIYKGETVGIIGKNGSGKSTLLKIIAGVTSPTSGIVKVYGRVASLLELGAGFHPLLTGRENIYLNASLLGMRKKQVDEIIEYIIEFSGIREFIDQPVDTYSSGMYVRLGFAIASHVNPDIFLVDEVLAVGDEEFQRKCRWKIGELHEEGKTIIFVSHDLGTVHALCDRVFLLENGNLVDRGSVTSTINYYLRKIGRESGIHTLVNQKEDFEAIFCHGRISLFHNKNEITSPMGIDQTFLYLQQPHSSTMSDWEIKERKMNFIDGSGNLFRLPIKCNWKIKLENNELLIESNFELLKEIEIQASEFRIFLPENYSRFFYDGIEETFPPLVPGDTTWKPITIPNPDETTTFVLSENQNNYPPLKIEFSSPQFKSFMNIGNTDYMSRSRYISIFTHIPPDRNFRIPGKIEGITLKISITKEDDYKLWAEKWKSSKEALKKILLKDFYIKLVYGFLEFFMSEPEKQITSSIHLHFQLKCKGLWLLSQTFFWGAPRLENSKWIIKGKCPRLPASLICEMWKSSENTIEMNIYLEVYEELELEEYNVSIALILDYSNWETLYERGTFSPISEDQKEYIHLNKNYEPSDWIKASGENLPNITLFTNLHNKFRMSPINPEFSLRARILQAIASPERAGYFVFRPGVHLLFSGGVKLEKEIGSDQQ
ncbi:MAG: ABC transporter ATP-binding protein [Candidatus Hydrogenedentes bacterium]|nr:ABC transporter ATP-binding protein [Candidatus Hydrogenedentota bacterium]